MSRSFADTLKSQLVFMTGALALGRFVVSDCGSIVHQLNLPEALSKLPKLQEKLSPFLDRASLIATSVLLILLIPRIIGRQNTTRRAVLDEIMALGSLALVGILSVHALAHANWSLGAANICLVVLFLTAAFLVATSNVPHRMRWPSVLLLLASTLPLAWRTLLWLGEALDSPRLSAVRDAADTSLLVTWALMLVAPFAPKKKVAWLLPTLLGGSVLFLGLWSYEEYRHILAGVTGLWYSTLSPLLITLLTASGAFALGLHLVSDKGGARAMALVFLAASAHQPGESAPLILQALALVIFAIHAKNHRQGKGNSEILFK